MAHGMQIFDAQGSMIMDITTSLPRIVKTVQIPTAKAGSYTVTEVGDVFYITFGFQVPPWSGEPPRVTQSGKTFTWTASSASHPPCSIQFGVR